MKGRTWNPMAILLLGLAALCVDAYGQTDTIKIKIGSQAPDRSPWGKALNEVAAEWYRLSNGRIVVEIYAGAIAGNELDQIRKMRIGTLQGGVFSNVGLNAIERSVFVLNTPFLFTTQEEFEYVFDRMKPGFEKQIEGKGFKVLLWTLAGWAHFFAKDKVIYPEDLKKYKISISASDPEMEQAWKRMGFHVVPQDMKDLMVGLQTGMVTATYLPTLIAGSGQYFALMTHMLSLKLSPLIGGFLLSDRAWRSIPEAFRAPMLEAVRTISQRLYRETGQLEEDALKAMKDNGLIIDEGPQDALEKWRDFAARGLGELVGKAFSREIYDEVLVNVEEFRTKNGH
jgi:TRAP-type C4-dicarboxylate transport system substrate-binding protein